MSDDTPSAAAIDAMRDAYLGYIEALKNGAHGTITLLYRHMARGADAFVARLIAEKDAEIATLRERLGLSEAESIGDEIIEIMQTRDQQEADNVYGGTPGGLEHMGDVWSLLDGWRDRLVTARRLPPYHADPEGEHR